MTRRQRSTPRIFVSYSHKDHEFGIQLVRDLRISLGDEDAVWYDKSAGLRGGDPWRKKILNELNNRNVFIVLLSPAARRSKWVEEEIDIASHNRVTRGMLIIPIVYRRCSIPDDLKRIQTIFYLPDNDYDTLFQELLGTLKENFAVNVSTPTTVIEEIDLAHLEQMNQNIEEAFDNEDWHYVIAAAKALITRYAGDIPASIYQMQGLAYIYADKIYPDQSMLAQEAIKAALTRVSDPEQRSSLLDVYASILILRHQWTEVLTCANEAMEVTSNLRIWQIVREEALKRVNQSELKVTSQNHKGPSITEMGTIEGERKQHEIETQSIPDSQQDRQIEAQRAMLEIQKLLLEIEKQRVEVQRARFAFERERITFALEIGDVIAEKFYPEPDMKAKAVLSRTLLPQLMQLGSSKAVELELPALQNTQKETKIEDSLSQAEFSVLE